MNFSFLLLESVLIKTYLSLVGGTITVQGKVNSTISLVLVSESNTGTQWHLSAYNTVAAIEVLGVHVHRAAFASDAAALLAGQLGQDTKNGHTHDIGEAVGSVGCNYTVLFSQGSLKKKKIITDFFMSYRISTHKKRFIAHKRNI